MKLYTEIITICDYANVSQEGKLNINGIFDEIRVQEFPGGLARAFLVATIKGSPDKSYKLTVKLENSKGENILNPLNVELFISPNGKSNMIAELVGLVFKTDGDYKFVIYHGNEEVGSREVKVMHVSQSNKGQQIEYKLPN